MGNDNISVIPVLRSDSDFAYEFLAVFLDDFQQLNFMHYSALDYPEPFKLINILNFPLLTKQSQKDLYGSGGINITGIAIVNGEVVSEGGGGQRCFTLTFIYDECISVSQEGVGELCCNCEERERTSIRCEGNDIGGSLGSGGGFGGGGGGGSGGGSGGSALDDYMRRLSEQFKIYRDSMINLAPDQIVNNVDCSQDPCLCEVIDAFSENPDLFENLGNSVSQLLQEIFAIPNYQHITITTTAVEGTTMSPNVIATHTPITGTGFPVSGMAYSEIIFNSNYGLNCTKVHLAATLLHESMHAYIEAQRLTLSATAFASMYPMYSTGFDSNSAHHITIADRYIRELSQSLRHMFPDPRLTDEYIEALTWQGLERTPAYTALVASKPSGFAERIEAINNTASCRGLPLTPHELDAQGLESCF